MVEIETEADNGYSFAGWVSSAGGKFGEDDDEAGNAWTIFHMPDNDVTVTAKFTANGGYRPPVTTQTPPPDDDDPWIVVVVDEDGTPQGEWRWDEETGEWIFDPFVPLGEPPDTGDNGAAVWMAVAAAALIGAAAFGTRKKKVK
jgi:LPXTG-motif cell wall-anchored protein/uncharacterized repeat protein (TIGR02543 family)